MEMLAAQDLHKAFGKTEALRGISISVAGGEVLAVTGPSGSGKSTLLLSLAGILQPDEGAVCYAGTRLGGLSEPERSRLRCHDFGLVLQFGGLVPELTAAQNVALPLLLQRRRRGPAQRQALEWLDRLGAGAVADLLPGQLSGGEAQRVAVARALVARPQVIFADEPTGALDTVNGEQVLGALLGSARESGATVVLVTHDNRVAAAADREVVLRDGRVETAEP